MRRKLIKSNILYVSIAVLLAGVMTLIGGKWTQVQAEDLKAQGVIVSIPAGGHSGAWIIGSQTFSANDQTRFDTTDAPLQVGQCARVNYVAAGDALTATEIQGVDSTDCTHSNSNPADNTEPNGSNDPQASHELTGTGGITETHEISQTPDSGKQLQHQIPGEPEPNDHPIVTGTTGITETHEISQTPQTENPNSGQEGGELDAKGRIDSLPANGLVGLWTIGGITYTVTANTETEQGFGDFAVGQCVEVNYKAQNAERIATKISTDHEYKCGSDTGGNDNQNNSGGDTNGPHGELYGAIIALPSGLNGAWSIGGTTIVADSKTEFDQEHGAFAIGATVKVEFYTDANGVNHALKIESKFVNDGGDEIKAIQGQAFGSVDKLPDGLNGMWIIGGVAYTTTNTTVFKQEHGKFAQGVQVRVEYALASNGNRIASEIEVLEGQSQNGGSQIVELVGFVQKMPSGMFTGAWMVGNITLLADTKTEFHETNGLLAVGAYVSLKYAVSGGGNHMSEIETEVPPGAGDQNHTGKIEDISATVASASAQAAAPSAGGVWRIGGANYVVTSATWLNDTHASLTVGSTVVVNSYTSTQGTAVATRIRTIAAPGDHQIFLPTALR